MSNLAVLLSALAAGPAVAGLANVITRARRHTRAERDLVIELNQHEDVVAALRALMSSLEAASPSPDKVAQAGDILFSAAESLDDKEKSEILRTLTQASNINRANFIVKLTNQTDESARPETRS